MFPDIAAGIMFLSLTSAGPPQFGREISRKFDSLWLALF